MPLNEKWHSRLPNCKNAWEGFFYGALYDGEWWAVAWWSKPVARNFNNKNYLELRRFAIRPNAPKNTASRFLGWMTRKIESTYPYIRKVISYQDTDVHKGTIYKASGWICESTGARVGVGWETRKANRINQSSAPKARWVKYINEKLKNATK